MSEVKQMLLDAVNKKLDESFEDLRGDLFDEEQTFIEGKISAYEECLELIEGILP